MSVLPHGRTSSTQQRHPAPWDKQSAPHRFFGSFEAATFDTNYVNNSLAKALQAMRLSDTESAATVRMRRIQKATTFLSLPREIRDVIYEYALDPQHCYHIECNSKIDGKRFKGPKLSGDGRPYRDPRPYVEDEQFHTWDLSDVEILRRAPMWTNIGLGLLRASRQLFNETVDIVYSHPFRFDGDMKAVGQVLRSLSWQHRHQSRTLKRIHLSQSVLNQRHHETFDQQPSSCGNCSDDCIWFEKVQEQHDDMKLLRMALIYLMPIQVLTIEVPSALLTRTGPWRTQLGSPRICPTAITEWELHLTTWQACIAEGCVKLIRLSFASECQGSAEESYLTCCDPSFYVREGYVNFHTSRSPIKEIVFDAEGFLQLESRLPWRVRRIICPSDSLDRIYEVSKDPRAEDFTEHNLSREVKQDMHTRRGWNDEDRICVLSEEQL
ncbi:MAG: hypothetical protein M1828_005318 [Chrysothrix sp. TS-e1954]|nr:MAG: hypothetical protein M1828_005318 [Chrysothrix sp. TS-e1954]